MTRVLRCGPLIGVLMLGLACGSQRPTAPSALPDRQTTTQPPSPPTPPHASAATAHSAAGTTTTIGRTRRDLRFQRPTRLRR